MELAITEAKQIDSHSYIVITNGKQTVQVFRGGHSGMINIINRNAAHRAWRGNGKSFRTFADARQAYRSEFMKSAIDLAESQI